MAFNIIRVGSHFENYCVQVSSQAPGSDHDLQCMKEHIKCEEKYSEAQKSN